MPRENSDACRGEQDFGPNNFRPWSWNRTSCSPEYCPLLPRPQTHRRGIVGPLFLAVGARQILEPRHLYWPPNISRLDRTLTVMRDYFANQASVELREKKSPIGNRDNATRAAC